jgi:DNA-binding CsgD family transcriptional regulator
MTPLIVVEGPEKAFTSALAEARDNDWTVVPGWATPSRPQLICSGTVNSAEDAAAALLAALAGAGLIVHAQAERDVIDRLCDDLRRIGRVDHRIGDTQPQPRLTKEERAIVDLLLDGNSLAAAARQLTIARRTADRRLASVRHKLQVKTTAEALTKLARRST